MDSSRSGLLSTILMTLPLIVVPAVALLRPPGQAGVSTVGLEASEGESELQDSFFDDLDGFDADPSGVFKKENPEYSPTNKAHRHSEVDEHAPEAEAEDDIFEDLKSSSPEFRGDSSDRASPSRRTQPDPFMETPVPHRQLPEKQRTPEADSPSKLRDETKPDAAKPGAGEIVSQLSALGALRIIWFEAGDKTPVGLAAFFRGSKENTRIRFESVGQSREACAQDVLQQVTRWQHQNPGQ